MKKKLYHLLIINLLCVLAIAGTPEKGVNSKEARTFLSKAEEIKEKFNQRTTSFAFTENKGQVHNQNNVERSDILYSGFNGQMVYHFKKNGFTYQQSRVDTWKKIKDQKTNTDIKAPNLQTIYRSEFYWLSANKNVKMEVKNSVEGKNNYRLSGGAMITDVHDYEELFYRNLYEGIDVKWYHKDGQLTYDYLVDAGADYSQIRLQANGLSKLSINSKGELVMQTPLGRIIEQAPFVLQGGKNLPSKWKLTGNIISFEISGIDKSLPFVIDPVVRLWGTYYGGSGYDKAGDGNSCDVDGSGNVFLVGTSYSGSAIATSGAYQTSLSGTTNCFLVKFNSSGVRQWGTYFGISNETGDACSVDGSGNIYVTGKTSSSGLATSGAHQTTFGGNTDAYLAKFNNSGVLQWCTYYGDSGYDYGMYCTTDGSGNVFIAGRPTGNSVGVIATSGAHETTFGYSAFLAKFNSSGVRQWCTYYSGMEDVGSISADGSGNIFMAGSTNAMTNPTVNIPTSGCHQPVLGGGRDACIVKFDANGVRQWGTFYGGSGNDAGYACATDGSGNVYLAGSTNGASGTVIATAGSHAPNDPTGGNDNSGFLVKFNSSGVRQWGTYYGGSNTITHCVTDASNNVYCCGYLGNAYNYPGIFATTGAFQTTGTGGIDAFIVKFNSSGSRQWGTYYGGPGWEFATGCTVDGSGNAYMCGRLESGYGAGTSSPGSHQPVLGSVNGGDAFLACFRDCPFSMPVLTTNAPICTGNNLHLMSAFTSTSAYSLSWAGPNAFSSVAQNPTITAANTAASGDYTFTIVSGACTVKAAISITVDTPPTMSVVSGSICSGDSYNISPSGAGTYTITGGSFFVSPISSTNYTITGNSLGGCPATNTVVCSVVVHPSITVNISATSTVICLGQTATLTGSGASTYTWSGGPSTAAYVVAPLSNTDYTLTGSSVNGCTNTAIQSVSVNTSPTLVITPSSTLLCSGQPATLTASGADTFLWSGGPASSVYTVSPLTSSNYTLTGTITAGGCTNTAVQSISVNTTPTVSIANTGTILCSGFSTTLTGTGANTYTWSGGPATAGFTVTPAITTIYTITGTATNGCTDTAVQNVSVNATPTVVIAPSSTVMCSTKSVTLTASGANTYTWNGGPTTAANVVSPSVTTVYTVTGTTAVSGCTDMAVQSISVNPTPTISITPGSTVLCVGKTTVLTGLGGNTYTWTAGPTSNTYAVSPGITTIYTVTGETTASGCTNTAVQSISVNALTAINISPAAPVICSGNTSTLTASGVTTYTWVSGPVSSVYTVAPGVTTAYTVAGTDAATGCSNTAVVSVSVNTSPTISVNSGTLCSSLNFIIVPSGASTYTISGGTATVSPPASPPSTSYSVTGTSAAGCVGVNTAVAIVSVFASPTVAVNSGSICTGNSFTMVPSGAVTYTYSSGSNIVSPMTSTNYSVTGSSTAGCVSVNTAIANVTVNVTPTLAVNSGTLCTGLVFTMVPTGASTYTFSSGSATVNPIVNTSYSVTGTSGAGCPATNTAVSSITLFTTPTVAATSGSICTGKNFTIVPSGAVTYTISGGSFVVSPSVTTQYFTTGSSTAGCVSANTATSTITPYSSPTINIVPTPSNGVICIGEYAWMVASGANTYTYTWSSGSIVATSYTVNPIANISYTVTGTSGSTGCTNTAVQTITVNTPPIINVVPSSTFICSGKSTTLSASGANTYTWSPLTSTLASSAFSPTANTVFTVIGTSANNCTAMALQSISVNITPTLNISPSSTLICSGQTATFAASGASTYVWSNAATSASTTLSPSVTTAYTVTGTTNACTNIAVQNLSVNATPVLTITPSSTVICSSKSVTLSASGGGTYTWSAASVSANISVSPSVNTTYTLYGTSASNNCTATAVQMVSVNPTPTLTISPSATVICSGKTATLTAGGANTYSWSTFANTSSIIESPSVTTVYVVTGTTSASGCTNTATQQVSVNTTPTVTLVQTSTVICSGKSVTMTLSGANSYSWSTGANFTPIVFSPTVTTNYSVVGYATNACTNSAAASISVNTTPTVSVNGGSICAGGFFTITPSGANTYTISGGSTVVSPPTNTTYAVVGTSTNGCVATNTALSTVFVNILPALTVNSGSICIGNTFTLAAGGATSYTWNTGANTASFVVSPTVSTIYTVTGSNAFNCIKTLTSSVAALNFPNVSIGGNTFVCIGSAVTLTAFGATSYTWSPGAQNNSIIVLSPTVSTTYSVKGVLGSNSCSNTAVQLITIQPKPILSISGASFVCPGNPVILTANGAQTYTWTGGIISNTISASPTISTTYSVNGTDGFGCNNNTSYQIKTASMITPTICLVTVDSISLNNEIYWDKTLFPRADTFIVYREYNASLYAPIGRIPKSAYSTYVDTNRHLGPNIGNPNHASYKYKMAYKDSCGNLSDMSLYHETVKIIDIGNGNFMWNLYNINGIPVYYANYTLWRYHFNHFSASSYTNVSSASGNSLSDNQYWNFSASDSIKWYVSMDNFVCTPSQKPNGTTAGKTRTKSNHSNERHFPYPESVNQILLSENNFKIYPNPAQDKFTVSAEDLSNCKVELTDLLGRHLEVPQVKENSTIQFDISSLKQGMYLLRISRGKEQLVKKVLVE